ncbi:MAG TPA: hypothetical protein VHV30_16005 [Polyangiaceae bacterium]|jgi:hypothetical protein|nr:hypothetical protein [Polyangiaceae bacterium]
MTLAATAQASLTPSEAEQVRRGVVTASDLGRVRALVARPDLSADEAANAVAGPAATAPLDAPHAAFFHEMLFGEASVSARPVLAPVVVRAVLARADAVLNQHALDFERNPAAIGEVARAYALVEEIASAGPIANVPASARAVCASAVRDDIAKNPGVLAPGSTVGPMLARVRGQLTIALVDLMPDAPTRRIDAADALGLQGPRRALLAERGVLVIDAGATDAQIAGLRAALDRFAGVGDPIEAVLLGGDATGLAARDGAVLGVPMDASATAPARLWGSDVRSVPGDAWSTAIARGMAARAVARVMSERPNLKAEIDRAGGGGAVDVTTMGAMLAVDGPLAVEVAAARFLAGHKESETIAADAIGALAAFVAPRDDRVPVPVGTGKASGPATTELLVLTSAPSGAASSFRLEGHTWSLERDPSGAVSGVRRDGAPVTRAMLLGVK